MSETRQPRRGALYVITCAARSSEPMLLQDFVKLAQADSWEVCVVATPQARKFIDIPLLENLTGYPVRSEYRHPEESDILPKPDAIVAAPTTFNTINKWTLGITDTLALGLLCEYMGAGKPIIAVPCVPEDTLARHPIFPRNLAFLREYGVTILHEPEKYPPMNNVPWKVVLQSLNQAVGKYRLALQEESLSK